MSQSLKHYAPIAGLALIARLTLVLWPADAIHPSQEALLRWPVLLIVLLIGFPAMHFAHQWGLQEEAPPPSIFPATPRAFLAGFVFALPYIALDAIYQLPTDLNVLGVIAIPFYTAGAFIVEVVLHLMPLVIWLGMTGQLITRGRHPQTTFWIGAALVAVIEPLTQLGGEVFAGYSIAFYIIGGVIIYAANFIQLTIFRKAGFAFMLAFRLGLYLMWHIIWGPLRLEFLF